MENQLMDFRNFLFLTWKHLNLPDPTPMQYDIAKTLQHAPKRFVVEAFRGVGKSWITSAYVCWRLYLDPQLNILVVSASKDRADAFSTFTKRLINEMPLLAHLKPRHGQRDSNIAFDVGPARASHAPSVKSVGITGQLTGSRADLIIADDVESLNNSATQLMRDRLQEVIKEFDAILKPGVESQVLFLGTPQTEMSIYNCLRDRGYIIRVWPARYPSAKQIDFYGDQLAPIIAKALQETPELAGKPTDPLRFSEIELAERELSYGKSGFALQFMLDTNLTDAERYPLRLSDLIITNLDIDVAPAKFLWARNSELIINDLPNVGLAGDKYYRASYRSDDVFEYEGGVMIIDPSGRGKDETSYSITKMLNGQIFLMASGGFMDGYGDETLTSLAGIAKHYKVNEIVIEDNFGDGMFSKLFGAVLKKIYPCTITEVKQSKQKERRIIDTLEPVMNQHRLIVDESVIRQDFDNTPTSQGERAQYYRLFYQMTRLTSEKGSLAQDDRLDALAMGVAYWIEWMERNVEDAANEQKEEWLLEQMTRHLEHQLNKELEGDSNHSWID
jgi:hypothetical protein